MKIGNLLCKGNINLSTANVEKKKTKLVVFLSLGRVHVCDDSVQLRVSCPRTKTNQTVITDVGKDWIMATL